MVSLISSAKGVWDLVQVGVCSVVVQGFPVAEPVVEPVVEEEVVESMTVRTTAYTHTEADHLKYGKSNAIGTDLKYGSDVRSAAADWSRFPVGTKFKMEGDPVTYEIDDYGGALVGKDVIDIYKPTMSAMRAWGAKPMEIEVIEWGCFKESLKILAPRAKYAEHVARMVAVLRARLH
ncbi:MAG: 3D domain-containing protein [Verrucomicrobiales bacterium]|nr:3D domain-containing protein [Verrucomicrobiales bacterium]